MSGSSVIPRRINSITKEPFATVIALQENLGYGSENYREKHNLQLSLIILTNVMGIHGPT